MIRKLERTEAQKFGRRGIAKGPGAGIKPLPPRPKREDYRFDSDADAAIAAHDATIASAERFVATFNWWLAWVGLGIMATGFAAARDILFPTEIAGLKMITLFSFEKQLFLASGVAMIVIGAVWLIKALAGQKALVMTESDISGFTLLGTKTIRWQDVSHIRVRSHDFYGQEVQIHATRGTPSSSILINCIPLYVKLTDKTADEVTAAIKHFRPDLG